MTLGDWDVELEHCTDEQLAERKEALTKLQEWGTFEAAFKWTCIFVLITMIECEQKRRVSCGQSKAAI